MRTPASKKSDLQSGQALLEYALLLAVAAILSVGFTATFKGIITQGMYTFNAVMEQELATGSYPGKDLWEN